MPPRRIRQIASIFLIISLCLGMAPSAAAADIPTETAMIESSALPVETAVPTETTETVVPIEAGHTGLAVIQTQINTILTTYLGTDYASMTLETAESVVANMDEDTYWSALIEVDELENSEDLAQLSEAEQQTLVESNQMFTSFASALYAHQAADSSINTYTTITMLDGQLSLKDTQNTIENSSGTVTATAKGSLLSKNTNTITITNNSGSTATLSFDYSVDKANSFTIAGVSAATSGNYSLLMAAGATLDIVITSNSGFSNLTVTLTMSNISLVAAAESSTVTLGDYDTSLGKATVGGGQSAEGSTDKGIAMVATPNSGVTFLGWINAENNALIPNSSASFTYYPTNDITVKPIFVNSASNAWFMVDNKYLTDDLNEACSLGALVVLMNSGTLKTGTYTIPAGDKLLIPNAADDTGAFTGEPAIQLSGTIETYPAKAFRTLTVPSGTTITCNGEINVNGHRSANGQPFNGHVIGDYGKIILGTESKSFSDPEESDLTAQLIIGSTGTLYCYGYITGSGMVEVQNSGTLHEILQLADWPGGNNGITWRGDSYNNLFLSTQYYVQNIEAPLKLDFGATQYVEAVITISVVGEIKFSAKFISSSSGMFIVADNGYVLRIYDQERDRMHYHFKGGSCTIGTLSMNKGLYSITTDNSILALTNNLTVHIDDGANLNLNKPVAILPGAELIVETGGTMNIESSALYLFDVDDWGGVKDNGDGTYTMQMFFNRIAQSKNESWTTISNIDVNMDPKTNPLPYVATLNSISPRATHYFRHTSDQAQPQTNPVDITVSGKLEVNGTLNINTGGYVYASSGGTSADKVITGTGTIVHNGSLATAEKSITVGTSDYKTTVNFNNALGNLAGVGEMQSFTNGGAIYHGLSEDYGNYWYQWKVSATATGDTTTGATVTGTSVPTIGTKSVGSNVLVGYIANSNTANGTFEFDITPPNGYTLDGVTASNGTVSGTGSYTLTGVTADTTLTLTLTKVATGATYSVTITWSQTSTATYTGGQTVYTWNTSDLKYVANTTAGGWNNTTSVVKVTIDNTGSTGGVSAGFGYTSDITSTMTGNALTVEAGKSETATLTVTPTGTPSAPTTGTDITLGTITITLTKEES